METWPCTSQCLKLGPKILTRDLNQAKKKIESEMRFFFHFNALFPASSFRRNFGPAVKGVSFFLFCIRV